MTASRITKRPSPLRGEGWGVGRELVSPLVGATRQEGLHAVDELLARGLRLLQVRLELECLLVARFQRVVDGALGGRQSLARLRGDLCREVAHLRLEALLGNDAVD